MGDETSQFADRFAAAVQRLGEVASGRAPRRGKGSRSGRRPDAAAGLSEALEAVEAVYQTGTGALRDWAETRGRVLAQAGAVRRALAQGVSGQELKALARDLLRLIEVGRQGR